MIYLLSPGIIDTFEGATIQTFNQWIGIRRAATQPLTEDDLYRSPLTGEATLADVLTWIHPAAAPKPDAAFFEAFEEDLSKWIGLRPGLHFNLPQRTPIYPEPPEHTSTH